jgi:hypothetical protein
MGMLTFSDKPHQVFVVPRLEDHLIDELFYQEDEIGEMRHSAFMIECGLEEDPPDGPDVPPIPWKFTPGLANPPPQQKVSQTLDAPPSAPKHTPQRTASMDDIEDLERELASPKQSPAPRRKLVVSKSGALHGMRKAVEKSHSADSLDEKDEEPVRARRAAPVVRKAKKMMKAKSGSLHGLREAAKQAQENNKDLPISDEPLSPSKRDPRRSRLVVTKSGTLHGMRKAVEKANAEDDASESPKKSSLRRSKLVVTKSGTLHGMRAAAAALKEGEKEKEKEKEAKESSAAPVLPKRSSAKGSNRRGSDGSLQGSLIKGSNHQLRKKKAERKASAASDTSEDESLGDFGGDDSDAESDVSLDTDEDVPKSPIKKKTVFTKNSIKTPSKASVMGNTSKVSVMDKTPEKEKDDSPTKPKHRVFKNGKLVVVEEGEDKDAGKKKVSSSLDQFRNGNLSPAQLLRNAQAARPPVRPKSSTPKKSASVAHISVPPAFQTNSASTRTRPGKVRMPSKTKSVSAVDIPPAFRASLGK